MRNHASMLYCSPSVVGDLTLLSFWMPCSPATVSTKKVVPLAVDRTSRTAKGSGLLAVSWQHKDTSICLGIHIITEELHNTRHE